MKIKRVKGGLKVKSKVKGGLFPSGPAKGACKVAGLPKPT
jgi:sulfur relay (sulfurtransferase) DsrC/TusE family protein